MIVDHVGRDASTHQSQGGPPIMLLQLDLDWPKTNFVIAVIRMLPSSPDIN